MIDWLENEASYFLSLRANGQLALAIFFVGFAAVFFFTAYWKRARIAKARAAIPLSIGGWGTRGKSGTERLKAAMFHGLGYEVSVKTTGCEAMLIHSVPDEEPHEIFLFRSFDKSTIWEQRDCVETAAALHSEVFLWECMALQPEFVELLQHDWMRDDMVTLTNAFPDHEDIQGPAGVDVAFCISSFIPKSSTLLTSELDFLPLFEQRARERHTRLQAVGRYAGDLLAADVLALFPYDEHPRNISLVGDVAEHFGLDRHMAIATMAEHVVPDIGVLKTYPPARVRGRVLRFINGMSANERTGFLNNWTRCGLNAKNVETMPAETIVTVVNNRWDRVSRSEVFARIMVEDAIVDAHLLIGTNMSGLKRYIDEALKRHCATLEVVIEEDRTFGGGESRARDRLAILLSKLRIATPQPARILERIDTYAAGAGLAVAHGHRGAVEQACARLCSGAGSPSLSDARRDAASELAVLEQMLVPVGDPGQLHMSAGPAYREAIVGTGRDLPEVIATATARDVVGHAIKQAARIAVHARLLARVAGVFANRISVRACNNAVRSAYKELFDDMLIVVEDATETGDQIIDRCARAVPPGTNASVMGIQNIKGTGLDFVYRWLAFDKTLARLARLDDVDPAVRIAALREIETYDDYGVVDAGLAAASLAARAPHILDEDEAAHVQRTLARVREIHERLRAAVDATKRRTLLARIGDVLEAVLDPLDSVRRRRMAERVMRDLIAHRISHERAAKEMRALYDRQGGGWLFPQSGER
jgi:gamma-polyglutamate synthase